jgi:ABC-type lipoprotein release transport system permease subunit
MVSGLQLAYDPGRGARAVPARSALAGAALGVTGFVAVALITTSITDLAESPSRYGWTWSAKPDFESEDPVAATTLREEDRVEAASVIFNIGVEVDGHEARGFAFQSIRGSIAPPVRAGRLPVAANEVALGARTMSDVGASIGDTVELVTASGDATRELEVVGEVVLPQDDNPAPGEGALLTVDGLQAVGRSEGSRAVVVTYPDGADVRQLEKQLAEDYPIAYSLYSRPAPPGSVQNLTAARGIITGLGVFFAVLAIIGLAHALVVSTRRRRPDLAVLRAIGFQRRQLRSLVWWHAVAVAVAGLVIGIPLGIVAGRLAWRAVVGDLGLIDPPTNPWAAIAVAVPAAVAIALALAWQPSRVAARVDAPNVLRAE